MVNKYEQEKYMIVLRYGYILSFILASLIEYKSIGTIEVIFLLFFVINNQLRYFILPKKGKYIILSLVLEVVLCYKLYSLAGSFGSVIFIVALMDILYSFQFGFSIIYSILITSFLLYTENINQVITWFLVTLPILVLLVRVKDEKERKIEAQDLYDKLRQRDEELRIANKELEAYANTIEEITLLRERNRVSREIHDNVGHALSTIIIQLGAIEKVAIKDCEQASIMSRNLSQFAKESMERVRAAVRAMRPRELEEYEGVIAISEMIKNFEKLSAVKVKFRVSDKIWRLNSDQTMVMYRIIQESLANSVRHGKATEVRIFLNFLDNSLRLHIKDNGNGCSEIIPGVGISSIKERVSTWGGDIECYTKEGQGFELIVTMDKGKLSLDGV